MTLKILGSVALAVLIIGISDKRGVDAVAAPSAVAKAASAAAADVPDVLSTRARTIIVPQGTPLRLRLRTTVASNMNRVEDPVEAVLVNPIVIDGWTVLPAGSVLRGFVSTATPSGRIKGRARLGLHFHTIAARGERFPVSLGLLRTAPEQKGKDTATIAVPAIGGAIVGALAGGKKGAAIGAAIGGGGGTAVVLATKGKEVALHSGTLLRLHLQRPVEVRVN